MKEKNVIKSEADKNNSKHNEINKKKNKKIKSFNFNIKYKTHISLIFQLIILFLPFSITDSNGGDCNPDDNKITLIIKGTGNKQILYGNIKSPDIVIINGVLQSNTGNNNNYFNFNENENTLVLKWNTLFTSLKEMFKTINDIISIDFSNFDTSKVTELNSMFDNCQVKSINFNNFNTSIVTDMSCMFSGTSFTSLDLSNFKTSRVKSMRYMFNYCMLLKELNIASFDTSSVINMDYMFSHAESLVLLNLHNFDTSSVTNMANMFDGCKSLLYINLFSFQEKNGVNINEIFKDSSGKFTYCIDENKSPRISQLLGSDELTSDCDNNCFSKSKIILIKNECGYNCISYECEIEESPDLFYSTIIEETTNYYTSTEITESTEITDEKTEITQSTEITDEKTEITESTEITDEKTENTEKNEITDEKTENIDSTIKENANKEKNENNFFSVNFFKEPEANIENITIKDEIIINIKEDIINGNLDSLITNITINKEDLLVKTTDTLFQITTTKNQKNNKYKNISTLDLGDCEDRLKKIYNIDKNLSLIIFKVDYYKEGSLIPVICYEIFHPLNKSQLDLNYCKDILINLNIPVSINEDNYFKYDHILKPF